MDWNYDFCMVAATVLFILIVYNCIGAKQKDFLKKLYIFLLSLSLACCITDMFSGMVLMREFKDAIWVNYIGEILYYSTQHAIPCCYFAYIVLVSREENSFDRNLVKWLVPGILEQVLIYTTPFTGWMFIYDADGYRRGPFMWVLIAGTAFYFLLAVIMVMKEGGKINKRYRIVTVSFVILPSIAVVIQIIRIDLILISCSIAMDCLIMQLILQNQRIIQEENIKEIEARLNAEKENRAKSTFLANMSHEIRTPMNAICAMADILEKCELPPHEMEYVRTIQVSAKNLLGIINNILDFSKVDAGKYELCLVRYRIDELLRNVGNIIAARAYSKNLGFEINVKPKVPLFLNGDSIKIQQVLVNILGNAVKYTEHGKITLDVSCEPRDGGKTYLIFKVSDTGIGIKEEDMPKLFNQFSQVDTFRNRKVTGTGLGLALSRGIANLMDGGITVSSEYGKGSVFTVFIEQQVAEYANDEPAGLDDIYIIFLYEEDEDDREHMVRILNQIGVNCIVLNSTGSIDPDEFKKYEQKRKIFMYNYEQFTLLGAGLPEEARPVALVGYYTLIKKEDKVDTYIRKPYDIFKVYNTLFGKKQDNIKDMQKKKTVINNVVVAVADDNKVNLKVAVTQLKEFNITAETFSSGKSLLRALERGRKYDIIFLDHMMPELDGIETATRIRDMEGDYFRNVPVIALTANAVEGAIDEYKKAGMNDCLFKPVRPGQLENMLAEYLPQNKIKVTG